jgi:hypothetical protein
MAGEVPISGLLSPNSPLDVYAVIDPIYGIDGLRSVASASMMYQIPLQRQRVGMLVYVQEEGNYYKLTTASYPGVFEIANFGGGSGSVVTQSYNSYTGSFSGSTFIGPMSGTFYMVTESFEVTNSYTNYFQYTGSFTGSFSGEMTGSFYSVTQSYVTQFVTESNFNSYSGSFTGSFSGSFTGSFTGSFVGNFYSADAVLFKDMISGQLEFPIPSNVFYLVNYSPSELLIDAMYAAVWFGTSSVSIKIDGTPVAGLTFNVTSSAGQMVSASNTSSAYVPVGGRVEMEIGPTMTSERLAFTLLFTRRVNSIL